jgi:hypothetical protein
MALGGPDTGLRMIAIKQQSGIPLTDKEVKRLARRQSVEAMYIRNGWGVNGGMQSAYNDASGHFQARSMANNIGGMQAQYGDANVGAVQGINMDRLRTARDNDLLHLQMNSSRSSMLRDDAAYYDQERQRRWQREDAGLEARRLGNEKMRFDNSHMRDVYDRGVAAWNQQYQNNELARKNNWVAYQNNVYGYNKRLEQDKIAEEERRKRMAILEEQDRASGRTPYYLENSANADPVERAKRTAIYNKDYVGYQAASRVEAEREQKRRQDEADAWKREQETRRKSEEQRKKEAHNKKMTEQPKGANKSQSTSTIVAASGGSPKGNDTPKGDIRKTLTGLGL